MMYGFGNGAMGAGWGWFGVILMWAIPVIAFFLILRYFMAPSDGRPQKTPREILDARYASGEIERDDYLNRINDMKN